MKLPLQRLFTLIATLAVTFSSAAVDVDYYLAAKGQNLRQTNASIPALFTNESPFRFIAEVVSVSTNGVTNVLVRLPSKALLNVTNVSDDDSLPPDFAYEAGFTNKALLDKSFAAGIYSFIIRSVNDGSNSASLTLPKDAYPSAPRIANWADAQEIESALPFVLRWDAATNLTAGDLVFFDLTETNGSPVLSTPDFLAGTNSALLIDANQLDHDKNYEGQLLFIKVGARNSNSVPDTTGIAGYFRQTKFTLATLPEPSSISRVQLSSYNYSVGENDGSASVTVTRVGEESETVSVNLATSDGSAVDGTNYLGVNTTLTFDPNVTATNVFIPILNDFRATGNKALNISLSGLAGNAYYGNRSNALLTIVDAQKTAAGKIQFAKTSNGVSEATSSISLTVSRLAGTTGNVGVHFQTIDGSAQAGLDYVGTNGTLIIPAAKTSAILPIRILNDSLNESNETFFVVLDSTSGGASFGTNLTTKVVITDNDPGGTVAIGAANYTTNENSGFFLVSVKRTGTGTLAGGASVDFTTLPGTAVADEDYFTTNGTLTFGSNELAKTIQVVVTNDTIAEGDENLFFRLSNPQGGAALGLTTNSTLVIKDDESSVSISNATYSVTEAGPVLTLLVIRSGALITPVSVQFATADGSATAGLDYIATNGTLTFPANTPAKTIIVPIREDSLVESNETFSVSLSNPTNGLQLGTITSAVVTIVDNDSGGSISFSTNSYSVSESGTNATITLVRSNGLAGAVTVDFITGNGTANGGQDYSNANQTVTFNAGDITKKVFVPIISDTIVEGNETVNLQLDNPTGGASLGSRTTATLNILEDDLGGVIAFQKAAYSANENATNFVVNVLRTGGKASGVSVQYHTQTGTATSGDFTGVNGTLQFAAGETNKTIFVNIVNDVQAEGSEQFNLILDNVSGGATIGVIDNATLTIVDDESSISISNASYSVSEAGTNVAINLIRSGALTTSVSVDFATVNGTAIGGSDFVTTNGTLTFAAGVSNKTVVVRITNDGSIENNETFSFRLSNPQNGVQLGTTTNAIVTILNDDAAGSFHFSSTAYGGNEGGVATIVVNRLGGSAGGVSVYLSMVNGTASGSDYVNASQTLTFTNGEMTKNINVSLNTDNLTEPAETVNLSLTTPTGGATIDIPSTAILTIQNQSAVTCNAGTFNLTGPGMKATGFTALNPNATLVYGILDITGIQPTSPIKTITINLSSIPVGSTGSFPLNTSSDFAGYSVSTYDTSPPYCSTTKTYNSESPSTGCINIQEWDVANKVFKATFQFTAHGADSGTVCGMTSTPGPVPTDTPSITAGQVWVNYIQSP